MPIRLLQQIENNLALIVILYVILYMFVRWACREVRLARDELVMLKFLLSMVGHSYSAYYLAWHWMFNNEIVAPPLLINILNTFFLLLSFFFVALLALTRQNSSYYITPTSVEIHDFVKVIILSAFIWKLVDLYYAESPGDCPNGYSIEMCLLIHTWRKRLSIFLYVVSCFLSYDHIYYMNAEAYTIYQDGVEIGKLHFRGECWIEEHHQN
ncbi:unnamed protein product [Caenorhabditis brenneri]